MTNQTIIVGHAECDSAIEAFATGDVRRAARLAIEGAELHVKSLCEKRGIEAGDSLEKNLRDLAADGHESAEVGELLLDAVQFCKRAEKLDEWIRVIRILLDDSAAEWKGGAK